MSQARRKRRPDQYQRLLEGRLRVLGPDHPDTLATRNNVALWSKILIYGRGT